MSYHYCPKCGDRLVEREVDGRERSACGRCDFVFYNNSRPCVGVLVVDGGRVLLIERADEPFKGYWDIPGGFLEAGEDPAAGAVREMREETGLEVEPEELLGFFMDTYGPEQFPTLNICYLGRMRGGRAAAGSDAASMRWFPLDDLPERIAFTWERDALEMLARKARAGGAQAAETREVEG